MKRAYPIIVWLASLLLCVSALNSPAQPQPLLRWEPPPAEATGVVVRVSHDLSHWVTYTRDTPWPSNEISSWRDRGFYQVAYQTVTGLCSIRCWLELPRVPNATVRAAAAKAAKGAYYPARIRSAPPMPKAKS